MRHILAMTFAVLLSAGAAKSDDGLSGSALFFLEDWPKALEKLAPEAAAGDQWAQLHLGEMYSRGYGVQANFSEARRLFYLAAKQGNSHAQRELGSVYAQGNGTLQEFVPAHMWYNISCKSSEKVQCEVSQLSRQFYDPVEILETEASCRNHRKLGCDLRDQLSNKMTPADISEAQRRARVCMESNYKDCD